MKPLQKSETRTTFCAIRKGCITTYELWVVYYYSKPKN